MKSLIKILFALAIMLVSIYYIHDYYVTHKKKSESLVVITDSSKFISDLREKHNNNEIMLYLEIPQVFSIPVPQTENNEYYYTHDIDKKNNSFGSPFLDYRVKSLTDKKLIIYGHKDNYRSYPFNNILNYQKEEYFKKNPKIFIYKDSGKEVYNIFTVFLEESDTNYLELKAMNNIEFYEHILKYKDKSLYDTGATIDGDSKVIVLTTSASDSYSESKKTIVVMAIEDRHYKEEIKD